MKPVVCVLLALLVMTAAEPGGYGEPPATGGYGHSPVAPADGTVLECAHAVRCTCEAPPACPNV